MKHVITVNGGGLSFGGMLTVLFVGLKLTGVIGWSWWWVLAPAWLSALFFISMLITSAILYYVCRRYW